MDLHLETEEIHAAQADHCAFTPLYERYFGDVFRFVLRRTNNNELTADLTQQTFLKAMLALPRYTIGATPFRAWLYRIALNEVRMYWRRRKEVVIDICKVEAKSIADEVGWGIEREEEMEQLATAMNKLSADKAKLIELRFMDGLSFAELGAVLGIGEDAAKMRTHRVLTILRTIIQERG